MRREEQAQITVFQILALNERKFPFLRWVHASMNGATASSNAAAGRRKACGQKSGVSDICIPYAQRGFHSAWIELKIKPNKLSVTQNEFWDAMISAGNAVKIAWSADDALDFIEWYFDIRLSR